MRLTSELAGRALRQ